MADFPPGGIGIQTNDVGRVELMSVVYGPAVFTPLISGALYVAGTILGRETATDELVTYNVANVPAGSNVPIAVLGDDLQATLLESQDITVIMTGQVRLARLIVQLSGVPGVVTQAVQDQLKDQGIFASDSFNLSKLDNGAV